MYLETAVYSEAEKLEIAQASRKAAEGWRFRHLRPKGQKALTAILASLVAFLARQSAGLHIDG